MERQKQKLVIQFEGDARIVVPVSRSACNAALDALKSMLSRFGKVEFLEEEITCDYSLALNHDGRIVHVVKIHVVANVEVEERYIPADTLAAIRAAFEKLEMRMFLEPADDP